MKGPAKKRFGPQPRPQFQTAVFFLLTAYLQACSATLPHISQYDGARPDNPAVVTFYALGDWGTGDDKQRAVAVALRDEIKGLQRTGGENRLPPFVLELGDNVYSWGLPKKGWNAPEVHSMLEKTFGQIYHDLTYDEQPVEFHVVPGNHDYNGSIFAGGAWGDVVRQETTAESLYINYKYHPFGKDGILDTNDRAEFEKLQNEPIELLTLPTKIPLNQKASGTVAIFALDTQVLLDLYNTEKYDVVEKHWETLESLLNTDQSAWKIIIGHHPLESFGYHGGYRPFDQWIWSGTRGFIPPVARPIPYVSAALLGTLVHPGFYSLGAFSLSTTLTDLYVAGTFFPSIQDMRSSAFKQYRKRMLEIMQVHGVKLYLSGHEHNLQFIELANEPDEAFRTFQVVSGSAAKLTRVSDEKGRLVLGRSNYGFVRFDATKEEIWLDFFTVNPENSKPNSVGRFRLVKNQLQVVR
ncbi:metallophosphoesterase [bacterium]|nr:metallophosphoesterase [bacterium]